MYVGAVIDGCGVRFENMSWLMCFLGYGG